MSSCHRESRAIISFDTPLICPGLVMNMVSYERGLIMNRSLINAVFYEQFCYERAWSVSSTLLWVVSYEQVCFEWLTL